jgi:RHS repeat-associated protein
MTPLKVHRRAPSSRRFYRRNITRKLVCFAIVAALLILPGPSSVAFQQIPVLAANTLDVTYGSMGYVSRFMEWLFSSKSAKPQENTDIRSSKAADIIINPQKIVGYEGQRISFTAIGKERSGEIVAGTKFTWSSSDTNKLNIDSDTGEATLLNPGRVWVTAATRWISSRVPVHIRAGARPVQSDTEWQNDQDQLRPDGSTATASSVGALLDTIGDKFFPTAQAQSGGADSNDFLYDELYTLPANIVGAPPNRAMDSSRIGAVLPEGSNFEFSVPIESLPGRGVPLGMALAYNSRLWSKHGSAITFNAVNTWPYVGFTLSFGRVVTYGPSNALKYVLIDSDGTRRFLGTGGTAGQNVTLQTNDGSHITYVGNATSGGTIYYNNGISKTVFLVNNRLMVVGVNDSNGNFISISYATQGLPSCQSGLGFQWKQAIAYVTDTLGRVINFNYDSCNNLISITAPDQGSGTRTLVQFDYVGATISNSFSGLTVENRPTGSVAELKHIYFPATQTGYKFDYSVYGMIYNVSMRKQMTIDQNGVISDGTQKGYVTFNYPTTGSSLTDAPSFTTRTEFPAATSGGTAVCSYATGGTPGTNKSFTITRPDSSTMTLTRSDVSGNVAYGLLTQTEIKNSAGTSMAKSVITYANDPGGSPQVQNVIGYDDATPTPNQIKVDFDYDSYGNNTNKREYGFQQGGSWVVRRRSRTVYKTDTGYINAYLRSLVIERDVYDAQLDTTDANDVLIGKTTYTWDSYADMGNMENYGGNYGGGSAPPGYNTAYNNQLLTVRGNLTGQTVYSDVVVPVSASYNKKIDIFGNLVQEQVSCCNLNTYIYSAATDWSTPDQVIKGDPNGVHVTKLITSDFNTSLTTGETDPNNQNTTFGYDNAGRLTQITVPTGANVSTAFNDNTPSSSQSITYDDGGIVRTVTVSTVYDDLGRVIQQVDTNSGQVNTAYDAMGRVLSRTNPFTAGGTPGPSTSYTYDALGRTTVVTSPDTQTVQTSYNGSSVTVTDQVNRKIQRISDGMGRLITVNEQDVSTGSLNQATNYSYDYIDHITQVDQGGQSRKFKYDAAGRLLYEKIPEQSATINDGTGTFWSCKYTYTTFNAVATKQDARGVISTYSYDVLHRLTQLNYSTVSGVTTAPTVTYTFDSDPTYGTTATGMLVRVNVGTDYQERYTFDGSMRPASIIRTIGSRTYTVAYGYNQRSQINQVTYPSARTINISYDASGRRNSLTESNNGPTYLSNVTYNSAGQVTGDALGNGVTEQFGYDSNRMQLTSQKAGTVSPFTNRMNLTYSYAATAAQSGSGSTAGNSGQLMAINNSSTINGSIESAAYTYDNLKRLATSNQTSNGSSIQRRFAYDRWGNRTGMWDATAGGNQIQAIALQQSGGAPTNQIASITSIGTVSYSYDAAGNVTNDGVHTYGYDSENRLVNVDGGSTASYSYDDQNRRYKKTVGSSITHYVWQGAQVLAEHNGSSGAVLVDYVLSGGKILAKVANGATNYLLGDRLSVRLALDAAGNVVGRQGHLPFGEDFAESGTQDKHHLTGYERDGEIGADYAVNRQYSQFAGRFMRVDPHGGFDKRNPQSLNSYTYVQNDPIDATDPRGLYFVPFPDSEWPPEPSCNLTSAPWQPGEMYWDCPDVIRITRTAGQGGSGGDTPACRDAKEVMHRAFSNRANAYFRYLGWINRIGQRSGQSAAVDNWQTEFDRRFFKDATQVADDLGQILRTAADAYDDGKKDIQTLQDYATELQRQNFIANGAKENVNQKCADYFIKEYDDAWWNAYFAEEEKTIGDILKDWIPH